MIVVTCKCLLLSIKDDALEQSLFALEQVGIDISQKVFYYDETVL